MDKYNPEQFEILGSRRWNKSRVVRDAYRGDKPSCDEDFRTLVNGRETYDRLFVRATRGRLQ